MLKRLKLQNLALIEIIEINFQKGLNVFTGESGSGKSLILDSLNSLFGGTNIPLNHLIRPEKSECFIEASFEISSFVMSWLLENNFDISNNQLIIVRNSFRSGNRITSKFKINGKLVKKNFIEELGYFLVDFAGQNDKYLFNSQNYLRSIIDDLGSKEHKNLNNDIQKIFLKLNSLQKDIDIKLNLIQKDKDNYFANSEILKILEDAAINDEDEINCLKLNQLKLSNNYELKNVLNSILSSLNDVRYENNSVTFVIANSIKQLNKIEKYDKTINHFSENLINIQSQIEEFVFLIIRYLESIENPEEDLQEVQSRLFRLQNLEKSFALDLPALIKKRNELKQMPSLDCRQGELELLQKDYSLLKEIFNKKLNEQSLNRRKIALKLEKLVSQTLQQLGLVNAAFSIELKKGEPSGAGLDQFQFLFSANPDQKLAPISSVISGGEMSRFLLALKSNISNSSNSLFFDEIDNGLSGKSLVSTINLIKKLSLNQQTFCITHHPLLAASAKVHFKVQKNIYKGLTSTSLIKLKTKRQKQNELVELIGGGFEEANDYALTLLNKAAA